jgi:hypothetical protein
MFPINLNKISKYVEDNISTFHSKKLHNLENLSLNKVLTRKNPYLFKAKNVLTAQDIVKGILDAHLSSQEETIFGEFLEGLAIFINEKTFLGNKSSAEGIDLEFEREEVKYIVSIKSGPNWGNSQQIAKMKEDFRKAKRILNTNTSKKKIIAVNGCCYGKDKKPDKGEYLKLCGQQFWEFISGEKELYTELIEPLGHRAKEKNEEFFAAYSQIINKFTFEFGKEFCEESGKINWKKLVKFNSASSI